MEFIDLRSQYQRIRESVNRRIAAVLENAHFVNGPEIVELESRLAAEAGVPHCVCCASGTDALVLAMITAGVKPGDAVFVPAFTFVAAAEVAMILGARPVFVDIEPDTFLMAPSALEKAMGKVAAGRRGLRPAAVVPVDLFGVPADYRALEAIAARYGATVIADSAQSFGASRDGRPVGSLAPLTITSFYPAKPLGAYGEGGAVFTRSRRMASVLRSLREHGMGRHRYEHVRPGLNARMHTLQAAVLLAKLEIFRDELVARQAVASRYTEALAGVVQTPVVPASCTSVWAQYTIRSPRRNAIAAALRAARIPVAIHYPRPLHRQPAFASLGYPRGAFPHAERAAREVLSLPMHPYLSVSDQQRVIDAVRKALR